MTAGSSLRALLATLALAAVIFLSACAVPLGPGFRVEQRRVEVHYLAESPPRLRIRIVDRLKNIGNRSLDSLRVTLPEERAFGRQDLHVMVDGARISPQRTSAADVVRIPFDPPWPEKRSRALVLEYELTASESAEAQIYIGGDSFHLGSRHWQADLERPRGLFAKGGGHAEQTDVSVWVPRGFLVVSGGHARGTHAQGGETEFRFRVREQSFEPYIVAGRYREQRVRAGKSTVVFWTFAALGAQQAQTAAARLAASAETYRSVFGSLAKHPWPVRVVETRARLPWAIGGDSGAAGAAFPEGVLLNQAASAEGIASEGVLELAETELARTWFGLLLVPQPSDRLLLGRGLSQYAALVAAEARGGGAESRRRVVALLRQYDQARQGAEERPVLTLPENLSRQQREAATFKVALFFAGLEDQYGKENVRRAIAQLVSDLAGREVTSDDLRAALEAATGHDLAQFFRDWLLRPGIPADFRARYPAQP